MTTNKTERFEKASRRTRRLAEDPEPVWTGGACGESSNASHNSGDQDLRAYIRQSDGDNYCHMNSGDLSATGLSLHRERLQHPGNTAVALVRERGILHP